MLKSGRSWANQHVWSPQAPPRPRWTPSLSIPLCSPLFCSLWRCTPVLYPGGFPDPPPAWLQPGHSRSGCFWRSAHVPAAGSRNGGSPRAGTALFTDPAPWTVLAHRRPPAHLLNEPNKIQRSSKVRTHKAPKQRQGE